MKTGEYKTSVQIKAYTLKELKNMYGVSDHVMRTWMKPLKSEIGKAEARYYNVRQVAYIFDQLGAPGLEFIFN